MSSIIVFISFHCLSCCIHFFSSSFPFAFISFHVAFISASFAFMSFDVPSLCIKDTGFRKLICSNHLKPVRWVSTQMLTCFPCVPYFVTIFIVVKLSFWRPVQVLKMLPLQVPSRKYFPRMLVAELRKDAFQAVWACCLLDQQAFPIFFPT